MVVWAGASVEEYRARGVALVAALVLLCPMCRTELTGDGSARRKSRGIGSAAAATAGQPVTVTATWVCAVTRTYHGPRGGPHTRIVQRPVTPILFV